MLLPDVVLLLALNAVAFVAMGVDKFRARRGGRRTPEATLLLLALLSGGPGAWCGASVFRHKTRKPSFPVRLCLASIAGCAGWVAWLTR